MKNKQFKQIKKRLARIDHRMNLIKACLIEIGKKSEGYRNDLLEEGIEAMKSAADYQERSFIELLERIERLEDK